MDTLLHNLEPLMARMGAALNSLVGTKVNSAPSRGLLLTVLTSPDEAERVAAYTTCLR